MSLPGIRVRAADASDVAEILRLLRHSLGEGEIPWSADFWRWKHQGNPFGPSQVLVADADGQLVGVRVFMQWSLRVNGKSVQCGRPVDTVTHPEWRRRGIFSELTREMVERQKRNGIAFIFNTPNAASRAANLKLGWTEVGHIRFLVKLVRPLRVIRNRMFAGQNQQSREPLKSVSYESGKHGKYEIAPARHFIQEEDASLLVEKSAAAAPNRISHPVSMEYLKWRYVDIPDVDYSVCWRPGTSGAAAIFRQTRNRSLSEIRICELLYAGAAEQYPAGKDSIRMIVDLVQPDYLLAARPSIRRRRWTLYGMGFVPAPRLGHTLVARRLGAMKCIDIDPFRVDSWELPLGSLELF